MLETFVKVLERQGKLKGDLNWTQRASLMWIMGREIEDDVKLERMRAESFALASNQQTSPKYIEHLMSLHEDKDNDPIEGDYEVKWQTPTSIEEVRDVLANLGLSATNA